MKIFTRKQIGTSVLVSRVGEKIQTLGHFTDDHGKDALEKIKQEIDLEGTGKLAHLYTRDYLNHDFSPDEHMGYAGLPETICLLDKFFSTTSLTSLNWMNHSKPLMCVTNTKGFRLIVGTDFANLGDLNMRIKIRLIDAEEKIRASLYRPIFARLREVH